FRSSVKASKQSELRVMAATRPGKIPRKPSAYFYATFSRFLRKLHDSHADARQAGAPMLSLPCIVAAPASSRPDRSEEKKNGSRHQLSAPLAATVGGCGDGRGSIGRSADRLGGLPLSDAARACHHPIPPGRRGRRRGAPLGREAERAPRPAVLHREHR